MRERGRRRTLGVAPHQPGVRADAALSRFAVFGSTRSTLFQLTRLRWSTNWISTEAGVGGAGNHSERLGTLGGSAGRRKRWGNEGEDMRRSNSWMHSNCRPALQFSRAGFCGYWIPYQSPWPAAVGDPCRPAKSACV